MPIVVTKNLKDKHIYNKMQFKIWEVKQINNVFFCLTVYKYQGDEIDTDHKDFK